MKATHCINLAGSRDGSLACLIGIAARNSIDTGKPIDIASLTTLVPQAQKQANTL